MVSENDSYLLKCVYEALEKGFGNKEADTKCAQELGLDKQNEQQQGDK